MSRRPLALLASLALVTGPAIGALAAVGGVAAPTTSTTAAAAATTATTASTAPADAAGAVQRRTPPVPEYAGLDDAEALSSRQRTVVLTPEGKHLELPGQGVAQPGGPPHPDPAFLEQVPGGQCKADSDYEAPYVPTAKRYGAACKRITFAFGPIDVKPGQNTAVLKPVTIEQPRYDGYIVRFKPDLVRSVDGSKPNTENLHLHHATWLNLNPSYGDGPFFAAGEEKTIANFPDGYGMRVGQRDAWGLLYMVHNALANPDSVWLTYAIDFVGKADGDRLGIVNVKPLWLDVQKKRIDPEAPSTSANPVYHAQRGFGSIDRETGTLTCTWPDQNCARFDTYGNVTPQQGRTEEQTGRRIDGQDYVVPASMAGTIVVLGGHLHPGGIRDEVSLVRNGQAKMIHISDAYYWDFQDPARIGAPPVSWNFSMTGTGAFFDWKVKIKAGDIIRLNAVYDTEIASWYENMGIVVAYVAPEDKHAPAGVDVFDEDVVLDPGITTMAKTPPGPLHHKGFRPADCTPDILGTTGQKRLCMRGQVTHGAVPESSNASDGCASGGCPALPEKDGRLVTEIHSVGFTYGDADLGVIGQTGIPLVKKGRPVKLFNEDTAGAIWHTYTRCKEPCSGRTTINYPLADGGKGADDLMDFDSAEIGYGLVWEPAKSQIGGGEPYDRKWVEDGLFWEFTPAETGVYSFYCRVHPGMRGAFKVVP